MKRRLTHADLTVRAGISVALVKRVEDASPGEVRIDTLADLADALDVDISALLPRGRAIPPTNTVRSQ